MILLNGSRLKIDQFPNGESRIPAITFPTMLTQNKVVLNYQDDSDLIHLMFLKKELDRKHSEFVVCDELTITYMPYSRMDRQTSDIFTLKYICQFINDLKFWKVTVLEPHSDVTMALLDNATAIYPTRDWLLEKVLKEIRFNEQVDWLVFPDAGAEKRYEKLMERFNTVLGIKHRDENGKIVEYRIQDIGHIQPNSRVLIVDDLCSYGGTFLFVVQALSKFVKTRNYLMVTHLESSVYEGDFIRSPLIEKIFATKSMQLESKDPKVKLFSV